MEQNNKMKNLKNRKFTAYAAILAALALAVSIPLNLLASRLDITWDMTPTKMYELTDTTRNFLEKVDKPVDFYFLLDMDLLAADTGSMALYHALEEYASYDNINLIAFEPDEDPELTKQLQEDGYRLSRGDIVIRCEGRSKHIAGTSMYSTFYSTTDSGEQITDSAYFSGENYITGAIDAVVSGRDTVVYFLNGHGEKVPEKEYSTLISNLVNRNYSVEELTLSIADRVPEDAALVILAAPQSDLSNDEKRKLDDYLDNGGNVCFWMSPNPDEIRYRNIEMIMESFGIAMDYDIVRETNSNLHIQDDPYTYKCSVVSSDEEIDLTYEVIETYIAAGIIPFMSNSRSFYQLMGAEDTSLQIGSMLRTVPSTDALGNTTSTAIGEIYGGADPSAEDITGEILDLMMYSTSTLRNDAKIMVMGNAEFIDDTNVAQDYMIIPVNLMLSTLSWMYDSELDMDMGIADKEQSYDSFVLNSEAAANTASAVFIAVPFGVALIGLIVWLTRRYS